MGLAPIKTTSVSEYLGADQLKKELLIPPVPGLYIWLRDPGSWFVGDLKEFKQSLAEVLGEIGQTRTRRIWPYWKIGIKERRGAISIWMVPSTRAIRYTF